MFGFLNICKPQGKTSHDVVAILRRITKVKQIGHTGTLDPFAEGVLPICIGKATRLIEYLDDDKAYVGTVLLGKSTSTYDTEGEIVNISDKKIALDDITTALPQFRGEIQQIPPIYSAIKVNGKKLYEYARKGEEVKIEPRSVNIHKLEIISFDEEKQILKLYIECSKGTYIRSIAHDLGIQLGCFGHLLNLVRVKAGKFLIENSINLSEIENIEQVRNAIINPIEYLDFPKYELNIQERKKVSHGMGFDLKTSNGKIILTTENKLFAIANVENQVVKILKVFC